jgi:uncharacterized protein YjlB
MDEHGTSGIGTATSVEVVYAPNVEAFILTNDGVFPNNPKLPLLMYKKALNAEIPDLISHVQAIFADHHWGNSWIDSVYDFHHYHSTAHEVLAVCGGQAHILFGGEHGIEQSVSAGDVIVIPAGVAHKNLGSERGLVVVGAYPRGQEHDMCYGKHEERPTRDRNIVSVPLPEADPLYGAEGPLLEHWRV